MCTQQIGNDSSTRAVFDPQKFELYWVPETFVLTGGSFKIPPNTSAVAIPLVKDGNPKIEYYYSHGVSSIDWNTGSVIYMAGNSSLRSDGRGNASCIFLLFRIKTWVLRADLVVLFEAQESLFIYVFAFSSDYGLCPILYYWPRECAPCCSPIWRYFQAGQAFTNVDVITSPVI